MAKEIACVIVDDEPVARDVLISFIEKVPNLKLLKSCKNALEAFELMNTQKVDLYFLDINMPEVSGLSLAKMIGKDAKVIFTTAYREYAVDGFNLKAVDYLLKPIAFGRFLESVNKYFETLKVGEVALDKEKTLEAKFFFVRSERKMVKINFQDILYIESLSDYIKIHQVNRIIVTRETITNVEAKLPQSQFLRIHRSYIVAIKSIESYTNEFVEIKNKAVPISRTYKESILKKMEKI